MPLVTTRRTGLVDQVIEQLRASVTGGEWPVDSRIPTEPELAELETQLGVLADAVERRHPEDVVDAEFAFFRTLNRSAGRMKLAWFLLHASRYLPALMYADDPDWGVGAVENHRKLLAALRRRDKADVSRLTNEQFNDAARRLTAA